MPNLRYSLTYTPDLHYQFSWWLLESQAPTVFLGELTVPISYCASPDTVTVQIFLLKNHQICE